MLPVNAMLNCIHSQVLEKVSNYMNSRHGSNYILYNLYRDRQLDHAANLFHQVTEYSAGFPKAALVQGLHQPSNMLQFSTPPPTLRQLFLIVLEMAAWIN